MAHGWGLPLVVLIVGMFMSILDTSIVNVAIPTIQNVFGTTTDKIQWIATSYTLVLGVVVPLSAWLSDKFGVAGSTTGRCCCSRRARRSAGSPGASRA